MPTAIIEIPIGMLPSLRNTRLLALSHSLDAGCKNLFAPAKEVAVDDYLLYAYVI